MTKWHRACRWYIEMKQIGTYMQRARSTAKCYPVNSYITFLHVCMYVCMYVRMYVYVSMHVCVCVCMCMYYVCMYLLQMKPNATATNSRMWNCAKPSTLKDKWQKRLNETYVSKLLLFSSLGTKRLPRPILCGCEQDSVHRLARRNCNKYPDWSLKMYTAMETVSWTERHCVVYTQLRPSLTPSSDITLVIRHNRQHEAAHADLRQFIMWRHVSHHTSSCATEHTCDASNCTFQPHIFQVKYFVLRYKNKTQVDSAIHFTADWKLHLPPSPTPHPHPHSKPSS